MKSTAGRCTKCVLSASFPRIVFDDQGVCNYCRNDLKNSTGEFNLQEVTRQIESLIHEHKGKHEYDAIMCFSGGKDSTYTLMQAVGKYGLKVLAFTFDNGFMSAGANGNIKTVVEALGVDHITVKPARSHMTAIIRASALHPIYNAKSLTRISSICNSCISMVNMIALKTALEKEIPIILAGFTLGQIPVNSIVYKNNYEFLRESREASLARLREHAGAFIDDYFCISESLLARRNAYPHTVNLLCLEMIDEKRILDAVAACGWKAPSDVDGCSSNCRLNSFNNMVHEKTFGYHPYELELSRLIRRGLMTREEALGKIMDTQDGQTRLVMNELSVSEEDVATLSKVYK